MYSFHICLNQPLRLPPLFHITSPGNSPWHVDNQPHIVDLIPHSTTVAGFWMCFVLSGLQMSERMNEWWYRDSPIAEPTPAAGICYSKHGWILDRFHLKSSVDIFILQRAHWCFNIPWNQFRATLEFTSRPLFSSSEFTYSLLNPHSCYLFYRFSSTKDVTRKTGQAVLKPFCTIVSLYSCDNFSFIGLTHLFQTSMPMLNVQLGAFSMDALGFPLFFYLFLDILFRLTCYFTCSILSGEYSSIIGPFRRFRSPRTTNVILTQCTMPGYMLTYIPYPFDSFLPDKLFSSFRWWDYFVFRSLLVFYIAAVVQRNKRSCGHDYPFYSR